MVTLRDATVQDAPTLCRAQQATAETAGQLVSYPDELTALDFAQRIRYVSDGHGKYLVACKLGAEPGEIVGHGCVVRLPRRRISHVLQLDLCVHPGHTGQGHGRLILSALIAWATAHPSTRKIELNVRAVNARAIALYASLGFIEEGRLRQRVQLTDGNYCDDICMAIRVDAV